jgi:thiamine transport system substrate-binding protein
MPIRIVSLLLAVGMVLTACGDDGTTPADEAGEPTTEATDGGTVPPDTTEPSGDVALTLVSHDSFAGAVTDETFGPFTEETGIEVEVFPAGDAGSLVNQAILTQDDPIGDVLFGVDDTFLSRALSEELFSPHESPLLEEVPDDLELDPEHRVTPVDFGDVCLNYDKAAFESAPPPAGLDDLTDPEYADLTVVESPATSSPGMAFLLATIAEFGEDGWQAYWRDLVDNGVKVVPDWDTAYYAEFTRYGGDRPIVVSYASSPPAEVIFAEEPLEAAPTAVVEDGCYRQIEFAGVLEGSEHPDEAGMLIDYMLSPEFQSQIPLSWFVFPANETVDLPPEFADHTVIPTDPAEIPSDDIEANRERWIEEWNEIVLP